MKESKNPKDAAKKLLSMGENFLSQFEDYEEISEEEKAKQEDLKKKKELQLKQKEEKKKQKELEEIEKRKEEEKRKKRTFYKDVTNESNQDENSMKNNEDLFNPDIDSTIGSTIKEKKEIKKLKHQLKVQKEQQTAEIAENLRTYAFNPENVSKSILFKSEEQKKIAELRHEVGVFVAKSTLRENSSEMKQFLNQEAALQGKKELFKIKNAKNSLRSYIESKKTQKSDKNNQREDEIDKGVFNWELNKKKKFERSNKLKSDKRKRESMLGNPDAPMAPPSKKRRKKS